MNDIIRRQINDVIIPQNDLARRPANLPEVSQAKNENEGGRIEKNPFFEKVRSKKDQPYEKKDRRPGGRGIVWSLLFALVLALAFMIANYFASATVEIEPIVREVAVDHDIKAVEATKGTGDDLAFSFIPFVEESSKDVPATVEKELMVRASGKVKIFNEYSKDSQRLIKNTRLRDKKTTKIYRIDQSVVVPGMKVINGKNIPGSIEALVYADAAGKEYNITEPADFTVPGFEGDPRYAKFKAMTIPGSQITGGNKGPIKIPSDEAAVQAQEELKQELKKTVAEKARAQIPGNMSLFPGSMIIKFEDVPQEYTDSDTAKVSVRANVSVFFFDTANLTNKLAGILLPENKSNKFSISNLSALEFKFTDPVDNVVLSDISNIRFHISGSAKFIGQIDSHAIRTELAGKDKSDFSKIINSQNNISKANAVVRPMWKSVFPSEPEKITVEIMIK